MKYLGLEIYNLCYNLQRYNFSGKNNVSLLKNFESPYRIDFSVCFSVHNIYRRHYSYFIAVFEKFANISRQEL